MRKRKAGSGESIYVFKVVLSDWGGRVKGMPYRVIACPEKISLYQLGETIIESFDFSFDHAFGFYDNIKNWYRSQEGYELFADLGEKDSFPGVKRAQAAKVFPELKKKMLFLFDYGDEWRFVVQLIKIEEPEENVKYPLVIQAVGDISQYGGGEDDEDWEEDDGEEDWTEAKEDGKRELAEVNQVVPKEQEWEKKPKIGRNDPCPCGSGKKYKKCCGAQEEKVVSLLEFQTEKEFADLIEKLCDFVTRKYLDLLLEEFTDFDLEFPEDPEEFEEDPDAALVCEAFIFDVKLSGNRTPFEEFIKKHGQGYRTSTLKWFEELKDSVFSFYEVTGITAGERVVLKDLLGTGTFDVYFEDYFDEDEIYVGDAIWCRLVPFRQKHKIFLSSIVVLNELKDEVKELVLHEYHQEKNLEIHAFLKDHSFILLQKILDFLQHSSDSVGLPEKFMGFRDPVEAEKLINRAMRIKSKKRKVELAQEALAQDHLCVDAYVILGEEKAETWEDAKELFQQGVKAGEKVLGQGFFKKNRGHFWGISATRPYMRAKFRLAESLWNLGERRKAAHHLTEMLELNPADHQGARYLLCHLLLILDADDEYEKLMKKYSDDSSVEFLFNNALFLFRHSGNSKESLDGLKKALEYNAYVAKYLLNIIKVPKKIFGPIIAGGQEEAAGYVTDARRNWEKTPGAISWLGKNLWLV
ncbi:IS1096 element passenger TnpR family protein [Candidatus Formimonas warabiya]|uniref:Plasmid pRiA4b Orf3-like domain-containing protein n=1 Tax=Formimonas warabiya TaxID=1761012 RepID=A0A3G1KWJ1_FORW1|nr:SEC-C metal-binding domain-containing protein [Candidatus Formimonas warabiya]ATW26816.1 hypothetical protein DCMF_20430 [Candidatus Formimonas warabiya]